MVESVAAGGVAGVSVSMVIGEREVGVIGGGPAGATAARLLASWGHSVALFARPVRQPLAESLPPSCVHVLNRVGVREAVEGAGFVRSSGNTVCWGAEGERVERFAARALGYQVERGAFDALLVGEAERRGVHVVRATVTGVDHGGPDARLVRFSSGDPPAAGALRCRWVLDCTGRSGLVARQDGRRRLERGNRTMALAAMWERSDARWGLEDDSHTLVEGYRDGWGWSVPASLTRRCVALMVDPARTMLGSRRELARVYARELAGAARLARLVRGAARVGPVWARDASPYFAPPVAAADVLRVGDAVSFVDPLSSFGVKKALSSAWMAAVVVHTGLTSEAMRTAALSLFEHRERTMYEALRRRTVELAGEAAVDRGRERDGAGFWDRAAHVETERDAVEEPDVMALRCDADVLRAFEAIRQRPRLVLRQHGDLRRVQRPAIRDHVVVLEDQLAAPSFEHGIRFLRNIDLVTLADLAPAHDQVPELYDAYVRAVPRPAPPLPDFLGALSVLVGKGLLALD